METSGSPSRGKSTLRKVTACAPIELLLGEAEISIRSACWTDLAVIGRPDRQTLHLHDPQPEYTTPRTDLLVDS